MKLSFWFMLLFVSNLGLAQVSLNEMQSSNNSTLADEFGEFDDWIEIHNPTNEFIDIGGLILKDQLDTWEIPQSNAATIVPPNGYFLLWADDQEFQGEFHTNFKLASGGEFLGLYESDGVTVIDSITLPAMQADQSLMRCDDSWITANDPTPLWENECEVNGIDGNQPLPLFDISYGQGNMIVVQCSDYSFGQLNLKVFALDGKVIMAKILNERRVELDLGQLENGIYVITVFGQQTFYSEKIIVSN